MKFEFNWPSGFRGEDVWKCWRTDDGRTDGRTDNGVTGILLAHPWAFGSGELIKGLICYMGWFFNTRYDLSYLMFVLNCKVLGQKISLSGYSTLDKQLICVNTQLKSWKKQLKWNVFVPKSNSNDQYAIPCDVIAYHLVHFVSIWVINKCQSGIDKFLLAMAQYHLFYE